MNDQSRSKRRILAVIGLVFVALSIAMTFLAPGTFWNYGLLLDCVGFRVSIAAGRISFCNFHVAWLLSCIRRAKMAEVDMLSSQKGLFSLCSFFCPQGEPSFRCTLLL